MSKRITMVGSANVDYIMSLPHFPIPGENVNALEYSQTFGGKGSNQSLAARRAGAEVSLVASIGADLMGQRLLENFREAGYDTDNVCLQKEYPCGTALIFFDPTGQNMLGFTMGANACLSREQVLGAEKAIASSAIVMMQLEIPDEPMLEAVRLAKKHGAKVMLNMAPFRTTRLDIGEIDILVVNETEAGGVLNNPVNGLAAAREAAVEIAKRYGSELVVITLGAEGSVFCEKGKAVMVPAFPVEARDATAAGDSYCGVLAASLVEGMPTAVAARRASAAGAICASRVGAQPSIPTHEDVERFLAGKTV